MKKVISVFIAIVILTVSVLSVRAAVLGDKGEKLTSDAPLNSWRYTNGVPNNAQSGNFFSAGANSSAWKETEDGFLNSKGEIIEGANMKGVDVSQWNGKINWAKVAETDVDYAIIRVGYGNNSTSQDDTQFKNNVKGCIENKIPFGVYIYSYATTKSMALSEAKHTLRLIKGYNLSFPVYFDLEDNCQTSLGASKLGTIAKTFCDEITKNGYQVGIYANLYWWNKYLTSSVFDNTSWYKWIAQYNCECEYDEPYTMWQCCSDGKVSGISGSTDLNFWYSSVRTASYRASVTSVVMNKQKAVIYRTDSCGTGTLKATVYNRSSKKGVKWSSSNTSIATVDSKGKIRAKKVGTCNIKATARDGSKKSAVCVLEVRRRMNSFRLNKGSLRFNKKNKKYSLSATYSPKSASVKSLTWISTNKKVAKVNSKGVLTTVGKGVCYICATSKDGSNRTEVCRVTINA